MGLFSMWAKQTGRCLGIWLVLMSLLLLIACTAPVSQTPWPTPTCYLQPLPTGEKIIGPTVEVTPPAPVSAGQVITVVFSGNYLIANNRIICGEDRVVEERHSDQLPFFRWERIVEVRLDEQALTSLECGYTCRVEVTIPEGTPAGVHKLVILAGWKTMIFDLVVVPQTP